MPAYNSKSPQVIGKGEVLTLWSAETPTPGTGTTAASWQVGLRAAAFVNGNPFAVDAKFSAAPGAFEVDVQTAAVDADANYQTILNGVVNSVDSVNNTFHVDGTNVIGRYVRLLLRTRTNSVSVTATVTGG